LEQAFFGFDGIPFQLDLEQMPLDWEKLKTRMDAIVSLAHEGGIGDVVSLLQQLEVPLGSVQRIAGIALISSEEVPSSEGPIPCILAIDLAAGDGKAWGRTLLQKLNPTEFTTTPGGKLAGFELTAATHQSSGFPFTIASYDSKSLSQIRIGPDAEVRTSISSRSEAPSPFDSGAILPLAQSWVHIPLHPKWQSALLRPSDSFSIDLEKLVEGLTSATYSQRLTQEVILNRISLNFESAERADRAFMGLQFTTGVALKPMLRIKLRGYSHDWVKNIQIKRQGPRIDLETSITRGDLPGLQQLLNQSKEDREEIHAFLFDLIPRDR
jgi:hypothetical protein